MIRIHLVPLVLAALLCTTVAAAEPPPEPESRETSFQAVSGSTEESVPGGTLMVAAYALLWTFAGLYLFRMGRAQRAIESEVSALEKRVTGLERKAS